MNSCVHISVYPETVWMCPQGEIDSANVLILEDAFWLARTYGPTRILLDMSDLSFISSAGLGQIIQAIGHLEEVGAKLVMGGLSEPVRLAMFSIGLNQYVEFGDTSVNRRIEPELYGIVVPGDLTELKTVRNFLESAFQKIHYDDIAGYGLKMAVDELVSNVIRHNYNGAAGKPVTVLLSKHDGMLEASVIDQGFAFDPTQVQTRGFNDTIIGGHNNGMGINLVRKLSDTFEYSNKEGHNIAQLTKNMNREPGLERRSQSQGAQVRSSQ